MKLIGQTCCGLIFLRRDFYGAVYSMNRWKAKRLIRRAVALSGEATKYTGKRIGEHWCQRVYIRRDGNGVAYVQMGCQKFSYTELQQICEHYGWKIFQ